MSYSRAQNVALLAGVTILSALSTAEAEAATTIQTLGFYADSYGDSFGLGDDTLAFNPFDTALGTLSGVTFDISGFVINREASGIPTATVTLGSTTLFQVSGDVFGFSVTDTFDGTASGQIPLSVFEGVGKILIGIAIAKADGDYDFIGGDGRGGDFSNYGSGLKLTYTYNPADVSSVPLPASIWLFGFGLSGLAAISRRRRRPA